MRPYGFTLLELLIAMAIIGSLSAIALPTYRQYVLKAQAVQIVSYTETLRLYARQLKLYMESSNLPVSSYFCKTTPSSKTSLLYDSLQCNVTLNADASSGIVVIINLTDGSQQVAITNVSSDQAQPYVDFLQNAPRPPQSFPSFSQNMYTYSTISVGSNQSIVYYDPGQTESFFSIGYTSTELLNYNNRPRSKYPGADYFYTFSSSDSSFSISSLSGCKTWKNANLC